MLYSPHRSWHMGYTIIDVHTELMCLLTGTVRVCLWSSSHDQENIIYIYIAVAISENTRREPNDVLQLACDDVLTLRTLVSMTVTSQCFYWPSPSG